MIIHHLRNATFIIESGENFILIDPMLSNKGELPAFSYFRHKAQKNPTVALPKNAPALLEKVTHALVTHSQKWGIEALTHTDHFDKKGREFLKERALSVTCLKQDAPYMKKHGLEVFKSLEYYKKQSLLTGYITAVPAKHGHGFLHHFLANGAGFILELANEPSLYISGDTVYTKDVDAVLKQYKPELCVLASGSASMDVGSEILMSQEEILRFIKNAPKKVYANHMQALNHCPFTRDMLKELLKKEGLLNKCFIPEDGESFSV